MSSESHQGAPQGTRHPHEPAIAVLTVGPFQENCYVIAQGGDLAIIDPGDEPDRLIEAVRRHAETHGARVRYVLLTHAHLDHVGAVSALREHFGCPVVLPRGEEAMLKMLPLQCQLFGLPPIAVPAIDRWIADRTPLPFGDGAFEILETPGHTAGGTSYRFNDHVFVGDTIFQGSVGRTDLWGGSWPTLETSIRQQLFPLPDDTRLYPGHGPTTSIGEEKRHNPFLN